MSIYEVINPFFTLYLLCDAMILVGNLNCFCLCGLSLYTTCKLFLPIVFTQMRFSYTQRVGLSLGSEPNCSMCGK